MAAGMGAGMNSCIYSSVPPWLQHPRMQERGDNPASAFPDPFIASSSNIWNFPGRSCPPQALPGLTGREICVQRINNINLGWCSAHHRPGTFLPAHPCLNKGWAWKKEKLEKRSLHSHRVHYSPWSVVLSLIILTSKKYSPSCSEFLSAELLTLVLSQESRKKITFIDLQQVTPGLLQVYTERISPSGVIADLQQQVGTQLLVVIYNWVTCYLF